MKEYVDVEVLKQQDFQDFSNTDVMYAIDNCPRADVEPVKHAHWIEVLWCYEAGYFVTKFRCSLCLEMSPKEYNYCPHCSAKMDRKEE